MTYAENANATDTGIDFFNLRGKITVTLPDGEESWQVGEVRNITWTKKGNIATVDISFSADNGTNWTPLTSGIAASNLTWPWNIATDVTTTTQAKIKVADTANAEIVFDTSNSPFELKGRLNITQPDIADIVLTYDGGQSNYNIIWTKAGGISRVNLTYSTNNGTTYSNPIATNISSTASPHPWTIPNSIGAGLRVKVEDFDNPTAVYDNSSNNFAIKGSIQVISPNGNESWLNGTNQSIQWKTIGTYPANVKIYFSDNAGTNWTEIGEASAGEHNTTQTWYWDPVPDNITAGGLIRVTTQVGNASVDISDTSNNTFRIMGNVVVTQPNGGEQWFVNDTNRQIRWNSIGTVTPVKIEYTTGGNWILVTNNYTGTAGVNTYDWTPIPDLNSEACRVRVTDNRTNFGDINDTSNATFSIRPQIFFQQPPVNANISAAANGTVPIRWNYTGTTIGDVNVEYSTNNGVNWSTIETNIKVENGTAYMWPNVPTLKTTEAKVRAYDVNNTNVVGNSSTFNIVGAITLTSPNGGQNWPVGSSQLVSWSSAAVSQINVSYSLNNETWTPLGSAAASPFTWNISNSSQVSNTVKIKVADETNPNVTYSISNDNFALIPVLDLVHPESGDNVTAEETYNISWTSKGIGADSVLLQYTPTGHVGGNWTNVTSGVVPNGASGGYYLWSPTPTGPLTNYYKMRVIYAGNANASSEGADYFNFRGNISVTRPEGIETWNVITTENITWTKKGDIINVDLSFSNDSGGNWTPIITGVNASGLIYPWNITNTTTTQGKIKVADSANADIVYGLSAGTFVIKGKLTLTAPSDAGIVMAYGDYYNITWQKFGDIPLVNLSYSTNGGGTPWTQFIGNLPGTYHQWEVPNIIRNTMRVRVVDADNPNVLNMSVNNFTIIGKVKVEKPDIGESDWVVGTPRIIQWTPTGTFTTVNITGSSNGFADENETWFIATTDAGENGVTQTFNWSYVGDHISSNTKIRVADADPMRQSLVHDESDEPFRIKGQLVVLQPNGNEVWTAGTEQNISWQAIGGIANVAIKCIDGGSEILITNSTASGAGVHSATWNVSDYAVNATKQAYIKVTDVTDDSVNDTSNAAFQIKGSVDLLTPSGGERLMVNDIYNVTWQKTGSYSPSELDTVKIEYSTNGTGGPYKSVYNTLNQSGDNVPAGQGYFSWKVNDDLSNNVRVRITRNADTVNIAPDISNTLSIIGKLTVLEPTPGVKWITNDTYMIKWERQGSIGLVDIGYFIDGANYKSIVSSWPCSAANNTTGNYSWTVNSTTGIVSPNVTVLVNDHNDSSVNNTSGSFGIIPKFIITSPVVDDKVTAGKSIYINWEKWGGDIGPVNLSYSTNNFANESQTRIIDPAAENLGTYQWMVNDTLSNTVRIRISYPNDTDAQNYSGSFKIWPNYTVIAPTSSTSHKWPVSTVQQIKWNCTSANASLVNIYYSTTGGDSYPNTIAENVNNSFPAHEERIFNWTVENPMTKSFKVKIEDANVSRPGLNATSPGNSWIIAYFNITYPQGNETLTVNNSLTINWSTAGLPLPNATINISADNFTTALTLVDRTDNDGSFSCQVPDLISKTVKIRVADADEPSAYDDTAEFNIVGKMNVSAPQDGDRFPIAYNTTVNWSTVGSIPRVNITAYCTLPESDPNFARFPYTPQNPLPIAINYNNTGSFIWQVNDTATAYARLRVSDYNDSEVWADSLGNFSIIGSYNITSPQGGESFVVGEDRNITWFATGSSLQQAKVSYSLTGSDGPWQPVNISWNSTADGIVDNAVGTNVLPITVPDYITPNFTVFFKVEDPSDPTVNSTSGNATSGVGVKIRGDFSVLNPTAGVRWITYENYRDIDAVLDPNGTVMNRTILWNTTGNIPLVNLVYSTGEFTPNTTYPVVSGTGIPNVGNFNWTVPYVGDAVPYFVKVRVVDANDTSVYADSETFNVDFYNITWIVRDFLSFMPIMVNLSVEQDSVPPWVGEKLSSGVMRKTPYGTWNATWSHSEYGDALSKFTADRDKNVTVSLQSKIVHVWAARTNYIYDVAADKLSFRSYLERDGVIAGGRDDQGVFHTIAENCTVEVYSPEGSLVNTLSTESLTDAGFFSMDWQPSNLSSNVTYSAVTQIIVNEEAGGGIFRTPFVIDLSPTVSLYNVATAIAEKIDVPLSVIQYNLTRELSNQTSMIESKMNEQIQVIENKTEQMKTAVNDTLSSFESRTYQAISDLQAGANQTIAAGQQALEAAEYLEATARKYSWSASVSPDPALPGDEITVTCQGEPSMMPVLNIYSWDNKNLIPDKYFSELTDGLYTYSFKVDSRFTPGKAYTYVITEPITGGLISGSGTVESMSMTSIAGLAAAAPEAERTAKKILDAVAGLEGMLRTRDINNIALTLKSIKDSIDLLPSTLAKEGISGKLTADTINEIAERVKRLAGDEGYDLKDILEKGLSDNPTLKEVRGRTETINSVVDMLLKLFESKFGGAEAPVVSMGIETGSVVFRIYAANPSKTKTQQVDIKHYLPQEVKPKDIIDSNGLDIEFDHDRSIYYVYKQGVELAPSEVRSFQVEVEDIWFIPKNNLDDMRERTDTIMAKLENTDYYVRAKEIADSIYIRLNEIAAAQDDEGISRSQHIGIYRQNVETVGRIKEDIAKLEKILATAGGPLAPEMLAKSKIKAESPTKTVTWIVIFTIIIFVSLLAGVLFFTWHGQAGHAREELLAAKKSAFPGGEEEEKKPGTEEKGEQENKGNT
ncbi:MAG: Ser-Thr-rich GPI-anchored membrane family protein [Candidatus Omnitrophota bacterium]